MTITIPSEFMDDTIPESKPMPTGLYEAVVLSQSIGSTTATLTWPPKPTCWLTSKSPQVSTRGNASFAGSTCTIPTLKPSSTPGTCSASWLPRWGKMRPLVRWILIYLMGAKSRFGSRQVSTKSMVSNWMPRNSTTKNTILETPANQPPKPNLLPSAFKQVDQAEDLPW